MRGALFIDRDGVVNTDHGYVHRSDQFEFIDGIFDLSRAAVGCGLDVVVVTNQAGIGRGLYSEDDFQRLTEWMQGRFAEEGAPISAVYYCPFHPEHGVGRYKQDSPDRKPNPGMLLKARDDLGIDLSASLMVGDRETDLLAALRAGVPTRCLFVHSGQVGDSTDPTMIDATQSCATHRIIDLRQAIPLCCPNAGA
jgi:D-glycero-D-manno-heptose 1,7-bisphosphate phosphatase